MQQAMKISDSGSSGAPAINRLIERLGGPSDPQLVMTRLRDEIRYLQERISRIQNLQQPGAPVAQTYSPAGVRHCSGWNSKTGRYRY